MGLATPTLANRYPKLYVRREVHMDLLQLDNFDWLRDACWYPDYDTSEEFRSYVAEEGHTFRDLVNVLEVDLLGGVAPTTIKIVEATGHFHIWELVEDVELEELTDLTGQFVRLITEPDTFYELDDAVDFILNDRPKAVTLMALICEGTERDCCPLQ